MPDLNDVANVFKKIEELYPDLMPIINQPGVADVMFQAVLEGWAPGRVQSALQNTQYWKSTTEGQRQWDRLGATSPAEQARRLKLADRMTRNIADSLGLSLNAQEIGFTALIAASQGMDEAEIRYGLIAHHKIDKFTRPGMHMPQGQMGQTMAKIKKRADDYAVPIGDTRLFNMSGRMLTGQIDEAQVDGYLREIAMRRFQAADIQRALEQNITVREYMDPYLQDAAKTLEINPTSIDLQDTKWQRAIDNVAADGTRQVMSIADWHNTIRTDAAYGYDQTQGAKTEAAQFAAQIGQQFGAVG